jgi:hypothetical protein
MVATMWRRTIFRRDDVVLAERRTRPPRPGSGATDDETDATAFPSYLERRTQAWDAATDLEVEMTWLVTDLLFSS